MNILKSLLLIVSAIVLPACVSQPRLPAITLSIPYLDADHRAYAGKGSGSLEGQAFLKQQGGGVVLCSGSSVILVPATDYFNESISALLARRSIQVLGVTMPMQQPIIRRTRCDAQGNFTFSDVPRGNWLVLTEVTWLVRDKQGGTLMESVTLNDGEKKKVILSQSASSATGLVDGGY